MALFRRQPQPASITSAANRVLQPTQQRSPGRSAEDLYALRSQLGQIRAALKFKSMAATKVEYYVARQTEPGIDPERVEDDRTTEAYERLRGLTGGFPEFVGEFVEHADIAGEAYLLGWGEGDSDAILMKDNWDVASPVEYDEARRQGYMQKSAASIPPILDTTYALRVWRQDAMRRQDADSPLRAVQAECQQYLLFRGMLTSMGQSRLVAPIIDYPDDWTLPGSNPEGSDRLMDQLFAAMEASISDIESPSRVVPITLRRPAESNGSINVTDITRDMPAWVSELMDRILRQIATGLDLPADILLGLADVNHWNAWLSEDSAKLDYVDPLILLILDSLTHGYLHPVLTEMGVPDAESYMFWRDYSDLIARSVGTEDAVALYDRGIISADATRRVVGFTEADAPEESPNRAPGVELPAGPDSVSRGAPPIPQLTAAGVKLGLGQIDHRLYNQLSEAAQAALDRSLEKAGQKIRSHVTGDRRRPPKHPAFAAAIDKVPNAQVGLTLGPTVKNVFQLTDDQLIPEGSFKQLGTRADKILESGQTETYETISGFGVERDEEAERGFLDKALDFLLAGLTALALRKLFTPDLTPDPAETGEVESTQIPAPLIFDTLTIAGGGEPGFGPEAPRGLANGQHTITQLTEAGVDVNLREWTVGAPLRRFEPHQSLRGTRFAEWTDPALVTPPTVSWLGVSYMFPGDHRGCQCLAELVVNDA